MDAEVQNTVVCCVYCNRIINSGTKNKNKVIYLDLDTMN